MTLSKILCKWKQDSAVSLLLYLDSVFKNTPINTSSGFFNFPNPPQFFTVNCVKSILLDGNT